MDVPGINPTFRAWAEARRFHLKRRPASFGPGDALGVPLRGNRGWLCDAAPDRIVVHFWATGQALAFKVAQARKDPAFHITTISDRGVTGWYDRAGFTDASQYVWRGQRQRAAPGRPGSRALAKRLRVLVAPGC